MGEGPILIAGGGIGGLAAAAALQRRGRSLLVLERAEEIREVGAGLTLQPNAMAALRELGLEAAVEAAGNVPARLELKTHSGRVLSSIDARPLYAQAGARAVALHRALLQRILFQAAGPEVVRTAAAVASYDTRADGVSVTLATGERVEGAALVGADGLRSAVRAQLLGEEPLRYSGYTSWRAVLEGAPVPSEATAEIWGPGRRFGVVPLGPDRTYWFATANAPAGGRDEPEGARARLLQLFADFVDPVPTLLARTPEAAILRTDIHDRQPAPRWGEGRVTLLGDAAHPMTPNLGQGACQAIEDAVVLARALAEVPDPAAAFRLYESQRRARADGVVAAARRLGALGQWENGAARAVRDLLLRATPPAATHRQMLALWRFG